MKPETREINLYKSTTFSVPPNTKFRLLLSHEKSLYISDMNQAPIACLHKYPMQIDKEGFYADKSESTVPSLYNTIFIKYYHFNMATTVTGIMSYFLVVHTLKTSCTVIMTGRSILNPGLWCQS
jgi:hypothetical protein